ncbi:MAG: hypothetical protein LAT53_03895 [Idiomarina sp.]|nr:hypothetical protein [Idiomarina sp.]
MLKSLKRLGLASVFILSGCQLAQTHNQDTVNTAHAYEMSTDAFLYLGTGFDFIQKNALKKESIDWNALREDVFNKARGAVETTDTYPALRMAIDHLDDQHSYLHTNTDVKRMRESVVLPKSESLPGGISLLEIPTHIYQSLTVSRDYIATAHRFIREGESSCGWIIDLRGNRGGNQQPMIVSLAPFLPPALDSYLWSPNGETRSLYSSSIAEIGPYASLYRKSRRLPWFLKDVPIAVLIDGDTGSSGEATLLQFIDRPNTIIMGTPTRGVTTNIHILELSDGANLGVANSYFVDRLGQVYRNGVNPELNTEGEDTIAIANTWLGEFKRCSGAHE